jgi:hypothetical protein
MTRSQLLALLLVDSGDSDVENDYGPQVADLIKDWYLGDDGCEVFVTAKGDAFINKCLGE